MKIDEAFDVLRQAIKWVDWNADFIGADDSIDKAYAAIAAIAMDRAMLRDVLTRVNEYAYDISADMDEITLKTIAALGSGRSFKEA